MFKLNLRGGLLGTICAVLLHGAVFAAEDPTMTFYEGWGHYKLEGSLFIDADQQAIWNVLTDYDHISQFVGNMKISHVESRSGNDLVLHQEPEGGFLFFTKRLHLELNVHETPQKSIIFQDTSHQDFDFYQGSWQINPSATGHGFAVVYTLDAQQNFSAPAFLASDAVSGAKDLLKKVREEILKRQNAQNKLAQQAVQITNSPKPTPKPVSTSDSQNDYDN